MAWLVCDKVKTTLTLLWFLAAFAALVAAVVYGRTRRLARKFSQLNQSYWELKYQYGQLNARISRLDQQPEAASREGLPNSTTAFVPLSSVKR